LEYWSSGIGKEWGELRIGHIGTQVGIWISEARGKFEMEKRTRRMD
jgi:hypothetical protein